MRPRRGMKLYGWEGGGGRSLEGGREEFRGREGGRKGVNKKHTRENNI